MTVLFSQEPVCSRWSTVRSDAICGATQLYKYLCDNTTQIKRSHCARQKVKRSHCARSPIGEKQLAQRDKTTRPTRQNNSPNEAKQLAQRGELQQTGNNSPVEETKLFFNMGVTMEQYRARIGTHNNFVKTKEVPLIWESIFLIYCLCCTIIENGKWCWGKPWTHCIWYNISKWYNI